MTAGKVAKLPDAFFAPLTQCEDLSVTYIGVCLLIISCFCLFLLFLSFSSCCPFFSSFFFCTFCSVSSFGSAFFIVLSSSLFLLCHLDIPISPPHRCLFILFVLFLFFLLSSLCPFCPLCCGFFFLIFFVIFMPPDLHSTAVVLESHKDTQVSHHEFELHRLVSDRLF